MDESFKKASELFFINSILPYIHKSVLALIFSASLHLPAKILFLILPSLIINNLRGFTPAVFPPFSSKSVILDFFPIPFEFKHIHFIRQMWEKLVVIFAIQCQNIYCRLFLIASFTAWSLREIPYASSHVISLGFSYRLLSPSCALEIACRQISRS